jgi:hypothetical protein
MAKKRWLCLVVVVAFLSTACGDSDADVDSGDGDEIPVNPDAGDGDVSTEPMCVEDEPDCDDTAVIPDEGQDLPTPDDEPATATNTGEVSSGMTVDGGLTVSEALATDATGTLAVRGYGFVEESGSRICESLAPGGERYECGGASVEVANLDLEAMGATVVIHDGLTYSDEEITVLGELVDGVLTVDQFTVPG